MHMKLWIADAHTTYIGSANLDYASLSQVKEFGVLAKSGAIAKDAQHVFSKFWAMCKMSAQEKKDSLYKVRVMRSELCVRPSLHTRKTCNFTARTYRC